jgi:glycosyltransferase involved in cell wall biosynthesis
MKVSVLIVTYNQECYIGQAIESVLAQKVNFDYEIIIGDDCSTDGTRSLITEFQRLRPDRIKAILRDRNIGANRNFAGVAAASRGQYAAFLEGDDYWTATDKLQKQVDFLDAHPDRSICCSRVRYFYEPGAETDNVTVDVWPACPAGSYTIEDVLKANFVATCSAVCRRHLMDSLPEWLLAMKLGDWPFWAMAARHGKIELMDEIMATYRVHLASMWSSQPYAIRLRDTARMFRALDKELGHQYSRVIRENIAPRYLQLAVMSRSQGRRLETAKYVVSYVRNGGWLLPDGARAILGMIAFEVFGSWYKVFSNSPKSVPAKVPKHR